MSMLTQAFALITTPQGSAIYHILIFFALEAAFGIALGHRRHAGPASDSTRLAIAAGLAGAAQGVLFILGLLGQTGLVPASAILAPLDRAVVLATLLLLSWAIVFRSGAPGINENPGRPGRRWADVLVGAGLVLLVIAYIFLAVLWYPVGAQGSFYNNTLYEFIWEISKLGLILLTLIELLIFRPPDWGIGFGLFLILLAGVAYHLINPIGADNYPAAQRIAEMAALPLFTVLVYRHTFTSLFNHARPAAPAPVASVPPRVTLTPQAASALAYIAVGSTENDFSKRVTEAVGRTLLADYTLLLTPPMSGEEIVCADVFDLIREVHLTGFSLPVRKISTIASAINRSRPARLRWETHQIELANLAQAMNIPQAGPTIMVPFADEAEGKPSLGGIVIMSAYTQKAWSNEDHNLLASIAKPLAKAFASFESKNRTTSKLLAELDSAARTTNAAQAESRVAQERTLRLAAELEQAREENRRHLQHIESLTAVIQAEAAPRTAAAAEVPEAGPLEETDSLAAEFETLQAHYRRSLEELASLNEELAQAQVALDQLRHESDEAETTHTDTIAALNAQLAAKQAALERQQHEAAAADVAHLETLATLQADRERAYQQLADTRAEIDQLRQRKTEPFTPDQLAAARVELERRQAEIQRLQEALATAQAAAPLGPPLAAEADELNRQLTAARDEIVELRSQLQSAPVDAPAALRSQSAMLLSLIQDLRQPLSSIIGYTDLLLGESVGIIGALQRNFLDRVKASAERMTNTLDDLIRLTAIDTGTLTLEEQNFEVVEVIEDAFTSVGTQFREKGISLRMDIADDIPPVAADRDAILQIISRLLTNACAASEPNTEVILTVRPQSDGFLFLSVRDTGGGISERDLSRVFSRLYRADRPLIQGLGDTGVGLSVAKALAEAQGGRIWVESEAGVGSTFSVILPANGHH